MSYSWSLPGPPALTPSPGSAAAALLAQVRSQLGGLYDLVLDPLTLDYVDTDDGEWLESADSRTLVMVMIEMRFGEDYAAPNDGTRIKSLLETGDPVTPEVVLAETMRVMNILVDAGIIADVTAKDDVDETGRFTLVMNWRDLASGSPVDLQYVPFQG